MSLREVERVEGIFIRILLSIVTNIFSQSKNFAYVTKSPGVAVDGRITVSFYKQDFSTISLP